MKGGTKKVEVLQIFRERGGMQMVILGVGTIT